MYLARGQEALETQQTKPDARFIGWEFIEQGGLGIMIQDLSYGYLVLPWQDSHMLEEEHGEGLIGPDPQ
jgi:hypothetical protein